MAPNLGGTASAAAADTDSLVPGDTGLAVAVAVVLLLLRALCW